MLVELRQVGVAEADEAAAGERAGQPGRPAVGLAGVVDHADPQRAERDHAALGQAVDEIPAVDVAVHGVHRRVGPELVEHVGHDQVAAVQDRVGPGARREQGVAAAARAGAGRGGCPR